MTHAIARQAEITKVDIVRQNYEELANTLSFVSFIALICLSRSQRTF